MGLFIAAMTLQMKDINDFFWDYHVVSCRRRLVSPESRKSKAIQKSWISLANTSYFKCWLWNTKATIHPHSSHGQRNITTFQKICELFFHSTSRVYVLICWAIRLEGGGCLVWNLRSGSPMGVNCPDVCEPQVPRNFESCTI